MLIQMRNGHNGTFLTRPAWQFSPKKPIFEKVAPTIFSFFATVVPAQVLYYLDRSAFERFLFHRVSSSDLPQIREHRVNLLPSRNQ
jgi:hypothetical protein